PGELLRSGVELTALERDDAEAANDFSLSESIAELAIDAEALPTGGFRFVEESCCQVDVGQIREEGRLEIRVTDVSARVDRVLHRLPRFEMPALPGQGQAQGMERLHLAAAFPMALQ